ncbi:MAG: DUF3575 domain-containing protein [Flavobacteriaceae bacterium]|jgi:hypothetical protein|nr:DUF3575 domain-containing protein [Flavobacteriaceae bacterium]
MKKIIAFLFVVGGIFGARAQALNEVKINIFNTIAIASAEVGYEHFIDVNQSIGADLHLNDRFSYAAEKSGKKFKTNSIGLNYNYYFGGEDGENGSGYVVTPFLKYRFGKFEENKWRDTAAGVAEEYTHETNMNSMIIGLGFGYKWALGDSFTISPFANIARNFSGEVNDRFSAIEVNAGVNIGFRF